MTRSLTTRPMLWTAGMDNDLAVRLNTQTGEFTEYLLPHRNQRSPCGGAEVRSPLQSVAGGPARQHHRACRAAGAVTTGTQSL